MDNRCFIIMPSSEPAGYAQGHFGRVYEYVVVPACRMAGFWPTRVDNATNDNPFDVIKNIVDSDVAIFDLSANNSNALYGLAVRQALQLPVTLMKDLKSFVLFNTSEFSTVEYDDSLRIDTVQKAIEVLSDALKKSVDNKAERHELLNRLGIGLPQIDTTQNSTVDTNILSTSTEESTPEEETPSKESLPVISPLPDYVGNPFTEEQVDWLKAGDVLFHMNYGKGKINFVKKMGKDRLANIQFESGAKLLVLGTTGIFRKVNKKV